MRKHEIGEEIAYFCTTCGEKTAHKVIPADYSDSEAVRCLCCNSTDEYQV